MDVSASASVQVSAEVSVVGTAAACADGIQIGGAFVFVRPGLVQGAIAYCNNIIIIIFVFFLLAFSLDIYQSQMRTGYQLSNKTELRVSLSLTLLSVCVFVCMRACCLLLLFLYFIYLI